MKLTKKSLLYDISNMAYMIADTGEPLNHSLHKLRDICEEGNIDRVSRVLGLAYSDVLSLLLPVISAPKIDINRDTSASPHDYEICFRADTRLRFALTKERILHIKELVREYMVSMVLAHWLEMTYPVAADVWKHRMVVAKESLTDLVSTVVSCSTTGFRRRLCPF